MPIDSCDSFAMFHKLRHEVVAASTTEQAILKPHIGSIGVER